MSPHTRVSLLRVSYASRRCRRIGSDAVKICCILSVTTGDNAFDGTATGDKASGGKATRGTQTIVKATGGISTDGKSRRFS